MIEFTVAEIYTSNLRMLKTLQIIALLQGVFLVFILLKKRNEYKPANFWLLLGCIVSVILYTIGDDDYHLLFHDANLFLFHDTLIITFFFLFVRQYKSGKKSFPSNNLWFLVPYFLYIVLNTIKAYTNADETLVYKIGRVIVESAFAVMLLYTVYDILTRKKEKWLLIFIIPLAMIFVVDEISFLFTKKNESPFFLDSYGVILAAIFLFYVVLYKLVIAPKGVLPASERSKYKTSNLDSKNIETNKTELLRLMTEEKIFKNNKLTVNEVAAQLKIPRQHLSEILNVHMNIGFQDFLNQYRVEEFILCLQKEEYKNYTLLAIANEVGFSSKSSFNTTFKKLKGMTPSQYKKQFS